MSAKAKECVLLFDEMSIKKCIEYSKHNDVVEGFEDLGEFGRRAVCAKQALVFMVRGLYANWKIPISFYFSEYGIKSGSLLDILKKNLEELSKIGLNPVSIICDQSSTNQKLFKNLDITVDQPFFYHNYNKYFAIFDPPHILKCIRNNFFTANFVIDEKIISFNDIRTLYMIDKTSLTGRSLPKLTDSHMNPTNFQKMNVRLAAQIFSHSVSAALKTAIETKQITSPTADHTAEFVALMDQTFDALNSRNLNSSKLCNRAIRDSNDTPMKALISASDVFKKIKKIDNKGLLKRPPCFESMQITIKAVQLIFETQKLKGYGFLLTSRLNQDVLENQFSIYRQRGGYCRNPTVRIFQSAFKANLIMNLMRPVKYSNCEPDTTFNLIPIEDVAENVLESMPVSQDEFLYDEDDKSTTSTLSSDSNDLELTFSLEDCSVVYFAGYLVKRCLDYFHCKSCENLLGTYDELSDNTDILLFYKNFNLMNPVALRKPSPLMQYFTKIAMKSFTHLLAKKWKFKRIKKLLSKYIIRKINKKIPEWSQDNPCLSHRQYILDLLVRTLLFKACKEISSVQISNVSNKPPDKLRILKNM